MKKISRLVVLIAAVLNALACGNPQPVPPGDVVASNLERLTTSAPASDVQQTVAGLTDFGFDLYRATAAKSSTNAFLSPHSVSVALSLAYAGAANATATAFEHTLKQSLPTPRFHRSMNDLDRQLSSRGRGARAADGAPFRLNITNQLFAEKTFSMETPFLDTLAQEYGANVRLMDFVSQPDPSRLAINEWVGQKTEGRILDLLPQGVINSLTRAVLVNAVYFNAAWAVPFRVADTRAAPFEDLNGVNASVPTMHGVISARAGVIDGVQVVALPYDGHELSMVVMVPPRGGFAAFEQALSSTEIARYVTNAVESSVTLSLPKFEVRSKLGLTDALKQLGLGQAFGGEADFSKMSKGGGLAITDVIHEAFVKVNEAGTEAAAATAVIIGKVSLPQPITIDVNRPFVFAIRDNATGAIVFVGRIVAL